MAVVAAILAAGFVLRPSYELPQEEQDLAEVQEHIEALERYWEDVLIGYAVALRWKGGSLSPEDYQAYYRMLGLRVYVDNDGALRSEGASNHNALPRDVGYASRVSQGLEKDLADEGVVGMSVGKIPIPLGRKRDWEREDGKVGDEMSCRVERTTTRPLR